MAQHQRNTFKLGLAVIVMIVLAFLSILFVRDQELFKPPQTTMRVRFTAAAGVPEIKVGAEVMYLGQRVGTVRELEFVDHDPAATDTAASDGPSDGSPAEDARQDTVEHFLEVIADVRADLDLRSDCRIMLSGPPLGGGGIVEIAHRGRATERLTPKDCLYGQLTGFQSVLEKVSRELDDSNPEGLVSELKLQLNPDNHEGIVYRINTSLGDFNSITQSVRAEVDSSRPGSVVAKLHDGLDSATHGLETLDGIVSDNRQDIRDAVVDGRQAIADSRDTMHTVRDTVARELHVRGTPAASLLTKVHDSMDCLNASTASLSVAMSDVRGAVALNKDNFSEIIDNLSAASFNFKQLTLSVLLNPRWLLDKPSDADKRERILFAVARTYAEAAARLDLTTARLQSLLESRDERIPADDPELLQIREELNVTLERFGDAERALLVELDIAPATEASQRNQLSSPPE